MRTRLLVPTVAVVSAATLLVGVLGLTAEAGAATSSGSSATSGSSGQRTHIVQSGDTVQSIARRYGVSADDVRVANGIVDDRLYLGARLVIDGSAASDGSSGTPATSRISSTSKSSRRSSSGGTSSGTTSSKRSRSGTYTVKAGDYLDGIAHRNGVTLSALLKANGLKSTSLILPGDRLAIPSGSSSSSSSSDDPSSSSGSSTSGSSSPARSNAMGPSLRCPVPGASFMNDWGFPRDGGTRFHEGNDLFAPKGTTIYAPAAGTIVYSSNNLGGSSFNLITTTGWNLYGAHLSAAIGTNRRVKAGEPIGRVGNTGDAAGGPTHLHFQLRRVNGKPINPYPSLVAACG